MFFRQETLRLATSHQIDGWVRNLGDGRVEAVFEGDVSQVEAMVAWAHRGPKRAWVKSVEVEWSDPEGEKGFRIRS